MGWPLERPPAENSASGVEARHLYDGLLTEDGIDETSR